jgi:hypothetical protein
MTLTLRLERDEFIKYDDVFGCAGYTIHTFLRDQVGSKSPEDFMKNDEDGNVTNEFDLENESGVQYRWVISCYRHGLCKWSRYGSNWNSCPWDTTRVAGIIEWDDQKSPDINRDESEVLKMIDAILDEYTNFCNGECYYYSWEDRVGVEGDYGRLEQDSCGGFIGAECFIEAVKESLGEGVEPDIVTGDSAELWEMYK